MKTKLIAAFLLLSLSNANRGLAQPKGNPASQLTKTTSTARRIIAQANYNYYSGAYVRADSTQYGWYKAAKQNRLPTITPYFYYNDAQSAELHKINFSDTIVPYSKVLKSYDAANNVVVSTTLNWNKTTSLWDSGTQTNYTYAAGKLMKDEMQQRVGGGPNWFKRTKNEYSYAGGLLDEKVSYTFRFAFSSDLKYYSKTNYAYSSGVVNSITTALWDSSATVTPDFYNYTRLLLTISGKDTTQKITQNWNKTSSDWRNLERKSFDFSKGIYSEDLTETWNSSLAKWENTSKDSLGYTGGVLTSHILFGWDNSTNKWNQTRIYDFSYTGPNLTLCKDYRWDGTKWVEYYEYTYQYDTYNEVINSKTFQWDGSKFVPSNYESMINYYYEEYSTTGLEEKVKSASEVRLYPNPAVNNHTYLDYFSYNNSASEIQVVDMMGREVLRIAEQGYKGDHSVMLNLDNLSNGIYLVNLINDGQLQSQSKVQK